MPPEVRRSLALAAVTVVLVAGAPRDVEVVLDRADDDCRTPLTMATNRFEP